MMNALKAKLRALAGSYPLYRERFIAAQGLALSDGTPEDLDAFVRDQIRAMTELVKSIGVQPQ